MIMSRARRAVRGVGRELTALHAQVKELRAIVDAKAQAEADSEKYVEGYLDGLRANPAIARNSSPRPAPVLALIPPADAT
jgi:hypothetical protein